MSAIVFHPETLGVQATGWCTEKGELCVSEAETAHMLEQALLSDVTRAQGLWPELLGVEIAPPYDTKIVRSVEGRVVGFQRRVIATMRCWLPDRALTDEELELCRAIERPQSLGSVVVAT